jgi:uncharacterized protein YktB (UPF0637 family)
MTLVPKVLHHVGSISPIFYYHWFSFVKRTKQNKHRGHFLLKNKFFRRKYFPANYVISTHPHKKVNFHRKRTSLCRFQI